MHFWAQVMKKKNDNKLVRLNLKVKLLLIMKDLEDQ